MKKTWLLLTCLLLGCFVILYAADTSFTEQPVVLKTATGDIHGSFCLPSRNGAVPVALIIAGSGPTDRNGNNPAMKNNSLKQLAEALALRGIASLRYDKRGIAESTPAGKTEAELRFDDYVADAREWVALLNKDSRFSGVTVIGHSEGSLIGMLAAGDADNFVSVAGLGRPADQGLREQLAEQPAVVKDMAYAVMDSLTQGKLVPNVNPVLYSLFRPNVQPYIISWFRQNPQEAIARLSIPVLLLQGTRDLQVKVKDAQLLAAANPRAKLLLLEDVNHVLKKVKDQEANIAAYTDPGIPIDGGLVNAIAQFVLAR